MDFLPWNPTALALGVEEMDREHEGLVASMNALHAAWTRGAPRLEQERIFDGLVQLTVQHFNDEEAYMGRIGFAGLASHRRIHEQLLAKLREHRTAFASTGSLPASVFSFSRLWLTAHIRGIDSGYVRR